MSSVPRELPGEIRTAMAAVRNLFLGLVQEGFTESQALQILGVMRAAGISKGGDA